MGPIPDDEASRAVGCLDKALSLLVGYWPAVDGAAAAFLELGTTSGEVKSSTCVRIARWVRSGAWRARRPAFDLPKGVSDRVAALREGSVSAASFVKAHPPHTKRAATSQTATAGA
jgi:hypothetical protein